MQHALTRAQPELDADGLAVWQQLGRLAGPGERQEHRAGEDASLTQGTTGWAALGARPDQEQEADR